MATKIWVGTDTGNEGDWSTAANWSPSGVPEAADHVYLENSSQDVSGGLDQSAIALASLNIAQTYTGKIGTDAAYLQVGASAVNIGLHEGPGSPTGPVRIKLDLGSATAAAVNIYNSGSSYDANYPTIRLKCANASTTVKVVKGSVGIAFSTGETSTLASVTVGYVSNVNTDATVYIGSGVTLTTFSQSGGNNVVNCAATTVGATGGLLKTAGSGAITNYNVSGSSQVRPESSGTITTLTLTGGITDCLKSNKARTVTNCTISPGATLKYDPNVVTITNKVGASGPVTLTAAAA